MDDEEDEHVMS